MSDDGAASLDLAFLQSQTVLSSVDHHRSIPSTNDRASQIVGDPALEIPCLVIADQQTAGRGRGTNEWWSSAGCLTFSLIVGTDHYGIARDEAAKLSLWTGIAVADAVREFVPRGRVQLKWPNDVFLNGKKVSGILIESSTSAPGRFIVGIGINVNNVVANAPEEIQQTAISCRDVVESMIDLTAILAEIIQQIDRRLRAWTDADVSLADTWSKYGLLDGRSVSVQSGTETVTGVCQGIDDDGALWLLTEAGPRKYIGGTVTRWN